ncbi:hypothetical protein, partial [Mycobacterium sp.]|uniref:hypothetical protein n=1 Tax=Mycobacterium sp. TaxID=1785 RepID=UPI003C70ACF4
DARFRAGDTVYLVGPYRELLTTLRKGLPPREPATGTERAPTTTEPTQATDGKTPTSVAKQEPVEHRQMRSSR